MCDGMWCRVHTRGWVSMVGGGQGYDNIKDVCDGEGDFSGLLL